MPFEELAKAEGPEPRMSAHRNRRDKEDGQEKRASGAEHYGDKGGNGGAVGRRRTKYS